MGWDAANNRGVLLHYSGGAWTSVDPPSVSTNWTLGAVYFTSPNEGMGCGNGLDESKGRLAS